ncbi:hypothetical protein CPB85DRAFT_1442766 [Mucidula mucida]|nr:hypothetical protein CPB85DRAFT_1442766 [Mucidula mucida]
MPVLLNVSTQLLTGLLLIRNYQPTNCAGFVIARNPGVTAGSCVSLISGGSAKSVSYSGVPNHASYYSSGGSHDVCTNGPTIVTGSGSGCATAPAG